MNLPLELLTEIANHIRFESDILSFLSVNLLHTKIPKIYMKELSYTYPNEFIYRMIYPIYISIYTVELNKYMIEAIENGEDNSPSLVTNLENILKKNYNKYSKICANNQKVFQDMIDYKIFNYEYLELRNFELDFSLDNNLSIKKLSLHEMNNITIRISCKNLEFFKIDYMCSNLKLIFNISNDTPLEINTKCENLSIVGLEKHKYITMNSSDYKSIFMYFDSIYNLRKFDYLDLDYFEIKNSKLFRTIVINGRTNSQQINNIQFRELSYKQIKNLKYKGIKFDYQYLREIDIKMNLFIQKDLLGYSIQNTELLCFSDPHNLVIRIKSSNTGALIINKNYSYLMIDCRLSNKEGYTHGNLDEPYARINTDKTLRIVNCNIDELVLKQPNVKVKLKNCTIKYLIIYASVDLILLNCHVEKNVSRNGTYVWCAL